MKITLHLGNKMSPGRYFYALLGGANFLGSSIFLTRTHQDWIGFTLGSALLISGLFLLALAGLNFIPSGMAPHVTLTDDTLSIRPDIFVRLYRFDWNKISSLRINEKMITINLINNESHHVLLNFNAAATLDIRNAVRQVAGAKRISVFEG